MRVVIHSFFFVVNSQHIVKSLIVIVYCKYNYGIN